MTQTQGKTVPNRPTQQFLIRPQIRISSSSPPLAGQLPGTLLLPEVDETVGGLRDGSKRPDGGVADPDSSFVILRIIIIIIILVQQIDDISEMATLAVCFTACFQHVSWGIYLNIESGLIMWAHPGWSLDPLGLASVNAKMTFLEKYD